MAYSNWKVTFASGATMTFLSNEPRTDASFYELSYGRIVRIERA